MGILKEMLDFQKLSLEIQEFKANCHEDMTHQNVVEEFWISKGFNSYDVYINKKYSCTVKARNEEEAKVIATRNVDHALRIIDLINKQQDFKLDIVIKNT